MQLSKSWVANIGIGLLFLLLPFVSSQAQTSDWRAYLTAARKFNDQNQFAQGAQYAEAAIKMNPASWEARYEAGRSYLGLGRQSEALAQFQAALQNAPPEYKSHMEQIVAQYGSLGVPSQSNEASTSRVKTIRIFQDQLSHGTEIFVRSGNDPHESSKVSEDTSQFHKGSRSLFFHMDRESVTDVLIDFQGVWRAQNVPYPGDLTRYKEKGALVFWIKSKTIGGAYEVGFWAESGQGQGAPVFTLRPLRKYSYANADWQKVIIPVTDFYNSYYWARVSKEEGGLRRWRRTETQINWKNVKGVVIQAQKSGTEDASFWIDDLALVPTYDRKAMKELKATAQKNEGGVRASDPLIIFQDFSQEEFWSQPPDLSEAIFDESVFYKGKKSVRASLDPKEYSMVGTGFEELDLSAIRARGALRYWVKGKNGGEKWHHGISCMIKGRSAMARGPRISSIIDVTTKWRLVKVPLTDYSLRATDYAEWSRETFDWERVRGISWNLWKSDEDEMVFYLDEIRFVPK